jgi:hypothetical protein
MIQQKYLAQTLFSIGAKVSVRRSEGTEPGRTHIVNVGGIGAPGLRHGLDLDGGLNTGLVERILVGLGKESSRRRGGTYDYTGLLGARAGGTTLHGARVRTRTEAVDIKVSSIYSFPEAPASR